MKQNGMNLQINITNILHQIMIYGLIIITI